MNQLPKAIFIGTYPILCLIGIGLGINMLIGNFSLTAIGLLGVSIPMILLLGKAYLIGIARTDRFLSIYSVFVVIGFLLVCYELIQGREFGFPEGLSLVLLVGWSLYVLWYSVFPDRDTSSLTVGQSLLDFSVEDEHGSLVSSDSFIGAKSIILFFRGNWCPLCMTQIKEIASKYKELETQGIQTILISPQPHRNTRSLAKKFDVGFKFLVDKNNEAAKKLNIFAKNGLPAGLQILGYDSDTVMPTIVLTDEQGIVLYTDLTENYRLRPEPDEFLQFFGVN